MGDNDDCPICLEIINREAPCILLPCNHKLHIMCTLALQMQGLKDDFKCPLCRRVIDFGPGFGDSTLMVKSMGKVLESLPSNMRDIVTAMMRAGRGTVAATDSIHHELQQQSENHEDEVSDDSDPNMIPVDFHGFQQWLESQAAAHPTAPPPVTTPELPDDASEESPAHSDVSLRGAQDALLTSPMEIPFFRAEYRRTIDPTPACAPPDLETFIAEHPPLRADPSYIIDVHTPTGRTAHVAVNPNDYVINLLRRILEEVNPGQLPPISSFGVCYMGKTLRYETTILSNLLLPGSSVELQEMLRGGKPVICFQSDNGEQEVIVTRILPNNHWFTALWPSVDISYAQNGCQQQSWKFAYTASDKLLHFRRHREPSPYMYYEFDLPGEDLYDPAECALFSGTYGDLICMLDGLARHEGLDVKNSADFVTYCLPLLAKGVITGDRSHIPYRIAYRVIRDEDCERRFGALNINLDGVTATRFIAVFKLHAPEGPSRQLLQRSGTWNRNGGRCLLEWGAIVVP